MNNHIAVKDKSVIGRFYAKDEAEAMRMFKTLYSDAEYIAKIILINGDFVMVKQTSLGDEQV